MQPPSHSHPGHILSIPAVQHRFHGTNSSVTGPSRLRFNPRSSPTDRTATYARHRNRALYAHALVLFNVVGIPLSQGVWLEKWYYEMSGRSLVVVGLGPGLQILGIFCAPFVVEYAYSYAYFRQRQFQRVFFFAASLVAVCVQIALHFLDHTANYIAVVLFQGPILGISLGTLCTISTLVLAGYYKNNIGLVGMMGWGAGFVGAVVYSAISRLDYAPGVTAGVLAGTLGVAGLMLKGVEGEGKDFGVVGKGLKGLRDVLKEKGTIPFTLGYILIFSAMFIYPLYTTLLLTHHNHNPSISTTSLLTLLTLATPAAILAPNPSILQHITPIPIFTLASILCGAFSLLPLYIPIPWLAVLCSAVYGIGLGAIIALHIKVISIFYAGKGGQQDIGGRVVVMMVVGGVSAFVGVLVTGVLVEGWRVGGRVAGGVAAGCLVGGGVLVGLAGWVRCGKL